MVRAAVLLGDGVGAPSRALPAPGLPLEAVVAGRPLAAHIALELAAYGIRELLVLARPAQVAALAALDGQLGGAMVRVDGVDDPQTALSARAEPFLLVEAGALLCDLAPLVASPPPSGGRLLLHGGLPTGIALHSPAGGEAEPIDCPGHVLDFAVPTGDPSALARLEEELRRPAAFLDRDGVINIDDGYTFRPEDLVFTPTAVAAIRALNAARYRVIVVTNQSGVARGYYETADVEGFHDHLQARLLAEGAHVDAFYYSPHHPDGIIAEFAIDHEDRKPSPGMLRRAMRDWSVRIEGSFMVGDKASDVEVAARAGIPGLHVPANVCDLAAELRAFLGAGLKPAAPAGA